MSNDLVVTVPHQPSHGQCQNAYVIVCNAHDAARSFLEIFVAVRKNRKALGIPTDEEQDLLRAMLVFACAGLDAMVKQLIKEALPDVIEKSAGSKDEKNRGAADNFRDFIAEKLKKGTEIDRVLLAEVLADQQPRSRLMNALIQDLTSQSLQSVPQLLRAGSYFDIPSTEICKDIALLKTLFRVRNEIAHEMDVDFTQANRSRRPRARQIMIGFVNEIFEVATNFLNGVDTRL